MANTINPFSAHNQQFSGFQSPVNSNLYPYTNTAGATSVGQAGLMGGVQGGSPQSPGSSAGFGGIMGMAAMANPYLAAGTLGLGLVDSAVGLYGLSQMGDSPNYSVSGELKNSYNRAESMADTGLTPEEMAASQGRVTRSNNTAYQNGVDMSGGNLAGALKSAVNAQNLNAANDLSAMDAQMRRQNMQYADNLGLQVQQQKNMATQNDIDQYNKKQQAYGQAGQSGLKGIANYINLLGVM